jgi:DNA helicase-2/ATP-dependent DNA helicase PcrA
MRKDQIKVGGVYKANVNGRLTDVRVDSFTDGSRPVWHVTNLRTGRTTTFRSAQKFRAVSDAQPQAAANPPLSNPAPEPPATPTTHELPAPASWADTAPTIFQEAPQEEGVLDGVEPSDVDTIAHPERVADRLLQEERAVRQHNPALVVGPRPSLADHLRARKAAQAAQPAVPAVKVLPAPARQTVPHLIVLARAGTGKTTTLIEGMKVMRGIGSNLTPSPQQRAVWDSMELSKGARSVCFVAFNTAIADELADRVPPGCEAMTIHRLGLRACRRSLNLLGGRDGCNGYRMGDIIGRIMGANPKQLRKECGTLFGATEELVGLCKLNLLGYNPVTRKLDLDGITREQLAELASYYSVDLTDGGRRGGGRDWSAEVFNLVPQVLRASLDTTTDRQVDFNDMIWLPTALGLPVFRNDVLLVDEAQDLNRAQQALAKAAGDRLILCGDDKQAIYGFAGADADSLPRMNRELGGTERGCITLPLTVTRRCGYAIVKEAQRLVTDFEAHGWEGGEPVLEGANPHGVVEEALYPTGRRKKGNYWSGPGDEPEDLPVDQTYLPLVGDGDMVLCRVNSPLVSQCFRFIKLGRKANIRGRDVGAGLVSLVNKLNANSLPDLLEKLDNWCDRETKKEEARKNPSDAKLISLRDRRDCLVCFCEGPDVQTVQDVLASIGRVFTDDRSVRGIMLSSIHKAKGLESHNVWLLMPEGGEVPHPMAKTEWQQEQESNLLYVAITRAINRLVYVVQK